MKNKKILIIILSTVALITVGGYLGYLFTRSQTVTVVGDSPEGTIFKTLDITRAELDAEFEDLQAVLMSAKVSPFRQPEQETIVGMQITDIQPNSFWVKMGFIEADIITQLNGNKLDGASSAMNFYSTLNSAESGKLEFKIIRNQTTGILVVNIK